MYNDFAKTNQINTPNEDKLIRDLVLSILNIYNITITMTIEGLTCGKIKSRSYK